MAELLCRMRSRSRPAVLLLTAFAALAAGTPASASALGELTQKAGTAGCFSFSGLGPCTVGAGLDLPFSADVSPDGHNVYVAGYNGDSLAIFDRGTDGGLTQKAGVDGCITGAATAGCATAIGLDGPSSVVVSPDGTSVYVASNALGGSNGVVVFDRAGDGRLTQKAGAAGCVNHTGAGGCADGGVTLYQALNLAISPDGKNLYVTSGQRSSVTIFDRAADGSITEKTGVTRCVSLGGSGTCTSVAGLGGAYGVVAAPDGRNLYVAANSSDSVVALARAPDGTLSALNCVGAGSCATAGRGLDGAQGIAVSPDGKSVYATGLGFSTAKGVISSFDRASDGSITQKGGAAGCLSADGTDGTGAPGCAAGTGLDGSYAVVVSPDGRSVYSESHGTNNAANGLVVLDRAADGVLTQKPGSAGCITETGNAGACADGRALVSAGWSALSPDGCNLYVASNVGGLGVFDRTSAGACAGGVPAPPQAPANPAPPPVPVPGPPAKASPPSLTGTIAFPATKACVSRRSFKIRLRIPKGVTPIDATVLLGGKRFAVVKGRRLTSSIDLRGLPKGSVRLTITLRFADGRKVSGVRRYKTCRLTKRR